MKNRSSGRWFWRMENDLGLGPYYGGGRIGRIMTMAIAIATVALMEIQRLL